MAEALADHLRVFADSEEEGGRGVPKIVEADRLGQARCLQDRLEVTLDKVPTVKRDAVGRCED